MSERATGRSHARGGGPSGAAVEACTPRAVQAVDAGVAADPDKAIEADRNQCQALHCGAHGADHLAAERFGTDSRPLTDAQGKALDAAPRKTLCPK